MLKGIKYKIVEDKVQFIVNSDYNYFRGSGLVSCAVDQHSTLRVDFSSQRYPELVPCGVNYYNLCLPGTETGRDNELVSVNPLYGQPILTRDKIADIMKLVGIAPFRSYKISVNTRKNYV